MRNFVLTALVVVCVVPLVTTDVVAAAPPSDACGLLTKAEVDAATGVTMGPAKAITPKACQWRQVVKQGQPDAIVDVTIIDARGYNIGKAAGSSGKIKITTIGSLGDEAYSSEMNGGKMTSLRFKKGETYVAVHVWGAGVPIPQIAPEELAIAKAILPKL